ncbi:hypothetical protein DFS34DRAFT_227039 [Phlyctochytrium arcticum]|nr:hypothetical protein DFS34DRAFT_227039 [Phlyctochytrium arcticum]
MPSEGDRLSSVRADQLRELAELKWSLDLKMAENRWRVIKLKVWAALFVVGIPIASASIIMAETGAKEAEAKMMGLFGLAIFGLVAMLCQLGLDRHHWKANEQRYQSYLDIYDREYLDSPSLPEELAAPIFDTFATRVVDKIVS